MADLPNRLDPGTNLEDNYAIINDALTQIDSENQTKIIRNGGTPTILFGKQTNGFNGQDYGLKIGKPGIDVTIAADTDLAFSSAFNYLKVASSATVSVPFSAVGGQIQTTSIPHGISGVPPFQCYVIDPLSTTEPAYNAGLTNQSGAHILPFIAHTISVGTSLDAHVYITAAADATNLNITVWDDFSWNGGGNPYADSYQIRYYIFAESLT